MMVVAAASCSSTQEKLSSIEPYNHILKRSTLNIENGEEIQMREILFAPGWKAPRHYHNSDLFIYVKSGEFEVDMEAEGLKTYTDGQALRMKPHTPMDVRNPSNTKPLKLAVFQIGNPDSPFVVPMAALADEECTFDGAGMVENVRNVASRYPGASIDVKNIRATWSLENGNVEYYEVGGCYDFGSAVGRATQLTEERSNDDVLQAAVALGQKYLPKIEFELLSRAVKSGNYEYGAQSVGEFFLIEHPRGGEIVISHEFVDGTDTVEVSWPGNI